MKEFAKILLNVTRLSKVASHSETLKCSASNSCPILLLHVKDLCWHYKDRQRWTFKFQLVHILIRIHH